MQRATGDVDFLVDSRGGDSLHEALLAAGARCLHRSDDAANYTAVPSRLAPIDLLYARRPRARAMLARARGRPLPRARLRVPVVDAEALIGLKLQPIIGSRVRDQNALRRPAAVRTLDEFLDFLRRVRALFGPVDRPRSPTTGDHFRL